MNSYEDKRMVLIATDYHEGFNRPHQTWVDEWAAELLLAGTTTIDGYAGLKKLYMAPMLQTRSGKKTAWYVKAGPLTLAEVEEWYATGTRNGEPFPPVKI